MITRTVSELAELCGATVEGDGSRVVVGPAPLDRASADEISFLRSTRHLPALERTAAAAVLVTPAVRPQRHDLVLLRCASPNKSFARVIEAFRPARDAVEPGVHATAVVAPDASLGEGVSVGPWCVVGPGSVLGDGVVLHARATIGARCRVGAGTVLHAGVVLYPEVEIGRGCLVHAGVVIGADGFGFDPGPDGWEKVPQCGTVVVEDEVEIGANSTIDRATFGATRIRAGAKLDDLVHVAHNVEIGPGAILAAQVGIAGSSKVGARAVLGGQVGVADHLEVGDEARLGAQTGVTKDLESGKTYWGTPAREWGKVLRSLAVHQDLPELARRVRALERRLLEQHVEER